MHWCWGLSTAEATIAILAWCGAMLYAATTVTGLHATLNQGLGGLCHGSAECAWEFGLWVAADSVVGATTCIAAISMCCCKIRYGGLDRLSACCRRTLLSTQCTGMAVLAIATTAGGVVVWHPLSCLKLCDEATQVSAAAWVLRCSSLTIAAVHRPPPRFRRCFRDYAGILADAAGFPSHRDCVRDRDCMLCF
jgi:hypothetical protein